MRLTLAFGAIVLSAIHAKAQTLAAWSGSTCDSAQGLTVPCDGSCHSFVGRHSFEVSFISFPLNLYSRICSHLYPTNVDIRDDLGTGPLLCEPGVHWSYDVCVWP
jgi:hypothetical protein